MENSNLIMKKTIAKLKGDNKKYLAHALERSLQMSVESYSKSLHAYRPQRPIEEILIDAFITECDLLQITPLQTQKYISEITQFRSISTAPHTEIIAQKRMFCLQWINAQGVSSTQTLFIGAFSGVPFSNASRPGRLFLDEKKSINFIPKTHQNALVFSTKILDKTCEQHSKLNEVLASKLPTPNKDMYFSQWASKCEMALLGEVLNKEICVFDINRVAKNYILAALEHTDHVITRILTEPAITKKLIDAFKENERPLHLFYSPYETGKYTKSENIYYLDGYGYEGDHQSFPPDKESLKKALQNDRLCPGTFLVFFIFVFLNDFQCFGSFVQVEYLSRFKEKILELNLFSTEEKGYISHVPTYSLTTGMFPNDPLFNPISTILKNAPIPGHPTDFLIDYYAPIWRDKWYYTNKQAS